MIYMYFFHTIKNWVKLITVKVQETNFSNIFSLYLTSFFDKHKILKLEKIPGYYIVFIITLYNHYSYKIDNNWQTGSKFIISLMIILQI